MGPASLKTSPPLGALFVRKRVHALLHEVQKEKMRKLSEVTFAYSFAEATFLHSDVKPKQTIDVPGMGCRFAFTISQVE